jgi:hypothetical protein
MEDDDPNNAQPHSGGTPTGPHSGGTPTGPHSGGTPTGPHSGGTPTGPHSGATPLTSQPAQPLTALHDDAETTGAGSASHGNDGPPTGVTVDMVSKMFPDTPIKNIEDNLPFVLQALVDAGLADTSMVLMALATIRAETASFRPISEGISKFNTTPGSHPFNLYDDRADLGNHGAPDGERFKGRGFVQLTGRANYQQHGAAIGLGNQLIDNPALANDPDIAAKLLASFLKNKEKAIRKALSVGDLKTARKLVNGGSHGLTEFTEAFKRGESLIGTTAAGAA